MYYWYISNTHTNNIDPFVASLTEWKLLDKLYSWKYKIISIEDLSKLKEKAEIFDVIKKLLI